MRPLGAEAPGGACRAGSHGRGPTARAQGRVAMGEPNGRCPRGVVLRPRGAEGPAGRPRLALIMSRGIAAPAPTPTLTPTDRDASFHAYLRPQTPQTPAAE